MDKKSPTAEKEGQRARRGVVRARASASGGVWMFRRGFQKWNGSESSPVVLLPWSGLSLPLLLLSEPRCSASIGAYVL